MYIEVRKRMRDPNGSCTSQAANTQRNRQGVTRPVVTLRQSSSFCAVWPFVVNGRCWFDASSGELADHREQLVDRAMAIPRLDCLLDASMQMMLEQLQRERVER